MRDPFRFTTIAHRHHRLCSPLSAARLEALLDVVALTEDAVALDVCAGKAELALRLIERFGCRAVALEQNPSFIEGVR